MKNKKIVLGIFIALVIIMVATFICLLPNNSNKFIVGKTLDIKNDSDYLVEYDDGDYYLMKANADIKFNVFSDDNEITYKIVDENDNEVETKISKKKNIYIISPIKNYEAGKTYKIVLEKGNFIDEKLKDIKQLYFTIVRPNSNTQVLNDSVIKVNNDTIVNIEEDNNYYKVTSNKEFKKDDILYYQDENEILVFKVDNIEKENDKFIMKTSAPTLEEIFKQLDIYGEFNLKLNDFITNEELKNYIEVAITENGLLDNIIPNVKAEDIFKINIEPKKDGSVKVSVSINLIHGEKSIFKKDLENHDMRLDIEFTVRLKAHSDITFFKHDVGASIDVEMATDFKITPTNEYFLNFEKSLNDDLDINLGLFKQELNKMETDDSKEEIPFIKIPPIKTPVPGLNVNLEIDFLKELELAIRTNLLTRNKVSIRFGHNNKGFYKNFDFEASNDNSYYILGKAEIKLGLEPKISVDFLRLIEAGIKVPLGIYADGQINFMNSSDNEKIDGKLEIGAFVSASLYAKTNIIISELEANYEKQFPIITLEGKITDKCEEQLLNGDFSCYVGTYTDSEYKNNVIKIDEKGIVGIPYYNESGIRDGDAKLESIEEVNGMYRLKYDIGYFEGQESPYYTIVPVGVSYEYSQFPCELSVMTCDSNNCRYDPEQYTCYYTSDNSKARITHYFMSSGSVYYKD